MVQFLGRLGLVIAVELHVDTDLGVFVERRQRGERSRLLTLTAQDIQGVNGDNNLTGDATPDFLDGQGGNDTLVGGAGNDTLIGGAGVDKLYGGTGVDYFQFDNVADIGTAAGSRDIIADWNDTDDYIDLRLIDANSTTSADDAFKFVAKAGSTFSGVKGELHWVQQNLAGTANDKTLIMGDTNGDKVADFVIEISGLHTIKAVDFLL